MSNISFTALKAPRLAEGCWPTPEQTLLLHAALSEQDHGIEAWREWNAVHDIEREHIDIGSYRLLPLVYVNILRGNTDLPHAKLLKGLYKRTWYENQVRLRACAYVLHALHDVGIDTLLLKGQALALQYYGEVGVRPMNDIDIFVPKSNALRAVEVLVRLGWSAVGDTRISADILNVRKSHSMINAEGVEIDLHWCVLHFCQDERINAGFWDASVPIKFSDVETRALCPTDQLLHVCAHGLMWNSVPPIRWVADVLTLLNVAKENIDWDRLVWLSGPCNASLQLHSALSYLCREFKADIPDEVIAKLEMTKTTPIQKKLYTTQTHGGVWRPVRILWFGFLLNNQFRAGKHTPFDFLAYLRTIREKNNIWQVLIWAGSKTLTKIFRQIDIVVAQLR